MPTLSACFFRKAAPSWPLLPILTRSAVYPAGIILPSTLITEQRMSFGNGKGKRVSKEVLAQKNKEKNAPFLREVLRGFYMKTHPDKLAAFPEAREINEKSFQELNNFLSQLKSRPFQEQMQAGEEVDKSSVFPPAQTLNLRFYILQDVNNVSQVVPQSFMLRTTGGNCKHVVQTSLSAFFGRCGLSDVFKWDDVYWNQNFIDPEVDALLTPEFMAQKKEERKKKEHMEEWAANQRS